MSATQRRRAEKRQRRQKRQSQREQPRATREAPAGGPFGQDGNGRYVEELVEQVAVSVAHKEPGAQRLVAELAGFPGVLPALDRVIVRHWTRAQATGWTAELGAHAARRLGTRHARWLVDGEPADVYSGVELVAWLLGVPPLPASISTRLDPADARLLDRVRALLAKAESTEFPEEAEALTAKAQQLVSRHSLEQALTEDSGAHRPGVRHVLIDNPYSDAKALLLDVLARANRCRTVYASNHGFTTVLGFGTDLHATGVLFTSLLVQATRAVTAAGDRGAAARQPSYRRSFYVAYANRIGERLEVASAQEVEAVADDRLLPVLAERSSAVDDAVAEAFPQLVTRSVSVGNRWGWVAGRAAADLADLAAFQEVRAS